MNIEYFHWFAPVIARWKFLLLAAPVLSGCGGDSGGPQPVSVPGATPTTAPTQVPTVVPTQVPTTARFDFDFSRGAQGWRGGFTDLPVNFDRADYNLVFREAALPSPLPSSRRALLLGGTNRSDDLWMFLKRRVTGLRPRTRYRLEYTVEFASNAPASFFGVGGSPGSSVFVKVGASALEPVAVARGDSLRLNVDKGEQAQSGASAVNIGNVGIEGEQAIYTLKRLSNRGIPFSATTDAQGGLWLFVGTESAFESRTELFYTRVSASLSAS